jgi:23S rRNA pseudouridine1911/1915/1917 synthase
MPSAPLKADEPQQSALAETVARFPEIAAIQSKPGRNQPEGGLIHRIDTETRGLLLFARTQGAYDFFIQEQESGRLVKEYTAFCDFFPDIRLQLEGFPPSPRLPVIESRFRSWGKGAKEVRPVTAESGKFAEKKAGECSYQTEIRLELPTSRDSQQNYKATCTISRGFRHQARCHLAWAGYPVIGDALYHPKYRDRQNAGAQMLFFASALIFKSPITGEELRIYANIN